MRGASSTHGRCKGSPRCSRQRGYVIKSGELSLLAQYEVECSPDTGGQRSQADGRGFTDDGLQVIDISICKRNISALCFVPLTYEAGAAPSVKRTETIKPREACAREAAVDVPTDPAIPKQTRRKVLTALPTK
jgi:hypothetical protein